MRKLLHIDNHGADVAEVLASFNDRPWRAIRARGPAMHGPAGRWHPGVVGRGTSGTTGTARGCSLLPSPRASLAGTTTGQPLDAASREPRPPSEVESEPAEPGPVFPQCPRGAAKNPNKINASPRPRCPRAEHRLTGRGGWAQTNVPIAVPGGSAKNPN